MNSELMVMLNLHAHLWFPSCPFPFCLSFWIKWLHRDVKIKNKWNRWEKFAAFRIILELCSMVGYLYPCSFSDQEHVQIYQWDVVSMSIKVNEHTNYWWTLITQNTGEILAERLTCAFNLLSNVLCPFYLCD